MRFFFPAFLCVILADLLGAASATGLPRSGLHPQDGPDVDLRIRIEEKRVRFNLILNLAYIDEIVEAVREDENFLHPVEHAGLHDELWEYFHEKLRVAIDDVVVKPVDLGFEVADPDLTLLPLFPLAGARALTKARMVFEFPVKSPPQRFSITWPEFPPDTVLINPDTGEMPPLQVTARLAAGGIEQSVVFTQEEPEYTWHASAETYEGRFQAVPEPAPEGGRSVPLLSIGLLVLVVGLGGFCFLFAAGRPHRRKLAVVAPLGLVAAFLCTGVARFSFAGGARLPNDAEASEIFQPLHANIYRAFDYTDESDVYDALAQSVHGDLLDRLYNEIYRSLIMQEEGGAVARVQAVKPLETEIESIGLLPPDDDPGFSVVTRWQVEGAVFHWGHSHHRTNEYQARYGVRATDAGWRIADSQVLEQRRIDAEPIAPGAGPVWPGLEDEEL